MSHLYQNKEILQRLKLNSTNVAVDENKSVYENKTNEIILLHYSRPNLFNQPKPKLTFNI